LHEERDAVGPLLAHRSPYQRKVALLMRRTILLLATMALTLLVASGVALAVTKIGTNAPDTLRGTNGDDNLLGKGGNDKLFGGGGGRDKLVGGPGKDSLISGINAARPGRGDKTMWAVPATIGFNPVWALTLWWAEEAMTSCFTRNASLARRPIQETLTRAGQATM
jgi:hypothetical protein